MTKYDLHSQKVVEEVPLPNSGCVLIKETPSLTCLGKDHKLGNRQSFVFTKLEKS